MSLPPANVTIRAPRKCGHCRQPGHNVFTCGDLVIYTNTLYNYAIEQIQRDLLEHGNGAIFEQWINELSQTDLKYLVWKITNTHTHRSYSRTILFEHFATLDIGYFLPDIRRVRNYFSVYQITELDVRYNANGAELHNYLKNVLSESQNDDVYFKIISDNDIRESETYQREFQFWFYEPGLMSQKQFVIHCHFAELGIGYNFHLQNIPGYNQRFVQRRSRQREERRITRENEITTIIKPDLLTVVVFTNNDNPYPIQKQIEYPLYKIDMLESVEDCCAICMETKNKKDCLTTECNHDFCSLCIGKMIIHCLQTSVKMDCPLCRTKLTCFTYCDENTIHNIIS